MKNQYTVQYLLVYFKSPAMTTETKLINLILLIFAVKLNHHVKVTSTVVYFGIFIRNSLLLKVV